MRSKKAFLSVAVSMLQQFITVVCGLITPHLILTSFGSGLNGITASVTQFLSIVSLLRSGVGGVTRAALYKPLADGDIEKISSIVRATEKFMRRIAWLFLGYLLILACAYPYILKQSEYGDWWFVASYVLILGIGTFAQYYFSLTFQLLLTADQREYIATGLQIVQTIANTLISVVMINAGYGLHSVKLLSALVYMITPLVLTIYVKRHYHLNRRAKPDNNALKQRWDAFTHGLAEFIHGNTDLMVLTVLTHNAGLVSVYSVYYLVINGIKRLVTICTTGLEAAFGSMIAKKETESINRVLNAYEFCVYLFTTILFTCVLILIVPFIKVYTDGVNDIDYYRPLFALIAVLAETIYCVRIPYSALVYAHGHYRQTKNGAMAEALINITLSVALVFLFELLGMKDQAIVGVAVGTLLANAFRTIQFIWYMSIKLLNRSILEAIKRVFLMFIEMALLTGAASLLKIDQMIVSYFSWTICAFVVFVITTVFVCLVNYFLYRKDAGVALGYLTQLIKKRK